MRYRATPFIVATLLVCLIPAAASAQIEAYSQDFELLDQLSSTALADDGWLVFGNVFTLPDTTYGYGYGPEPAPNDGFGFCQIDILQGGVDQGFQQLSVFSDYNNGDHATSLIESNVYREWVIRRENVGQLWIFFFEAKLGNLVAPSTAAAFIKTLDPNAGHALTNFITEDMTSTPVTWTGYSIELYIDPSLEDQIFQIGFLNTATLFASSGIFYDNVNFYKDPVTGVPPSTAARGMTLSQNYPNPFNPSTKIQFSLDKPGKVEISVYDLAGRLVATLQKAELGIGDHSVVWDGRNDSGAPVASGQYRYVLRTATGEISRSMILLK